MAIISKVFLIGTIIYTKLHGKLVGKDEFGNRYFRSNAKEGERIGNPNKERRWVLYNGKTEPSKVPPLWYGWLHYTVDEIPSKKDKDNQHKWQKSHLPNLTASKFAYTPSDEKSANYTAWKP